jgi:dipeptidase D
VARDGFGNLCVSVPATAGREKAPTVVLQSHLDMVCERNADSPYDPEKGTIHVVRDGDWLRAEGTTLGADNGIGVATMLYVGDDTTLSHGPIELLFTLTEETGLTGAKNLDPAIVRGRALINLESEDDGIIFVGCAGGCDLRTLWKAPLTAVPSDWVAGNLAISGLKGGHSGADIEKNRLNAIHALARLLQEVGKKASFVLREVTGGNKRNAIPRECQATLFYPPADLQTIRESLKQTQEALAVQYRGLEDDLKVTFRERLAEVPRQAFSPEQTRHLLNVLRALPTGPLTMSQEIPGLVETSTNLAVIRTAGETVDIACSSRSSVASALRDTLDTLHAIAHLAGASAEESEYYPGWRPNMSSPVVALTKQVYQRIFGAAPVVTAIHAGLECGVIGERVAGMDMISFGPQITGVHAPGERVQVSSVQKFVTLLKGVLEALSTQR